MVKKSQKYPLPKDIPKFKNRLQGFSEKNWIIFHPNDVFSHINL